MPETVRSLPRFAIFSWLIVTAVVAASLSTASPVSAAPTATIQGVVTAPAGYTLMNSTQVRLKQTIAPWTTVATTTVDNATGSYSFTAQPGTYLLQFYYNGHNGLMTSYWGDSFDPRTAPRVTLTDGGVFTYDYQLVVGGKITGTILGEGAATGTAQGSVTYLSGTLISENNGLDTINRTTGEFTFARLTPGTWRFTQCDLQPYKCEYDDIVVGLGQVINNGVTDLEAYRTVSGSVTAVNGGGPVAGLKVTLIDQIDPYYTGHSKTTWTGADGKYTFENVDQGPYKVCFSEASYTDYVYECWGSESGHPDGSVIDVDGSNVIDVNASVVKRSTLTGKVTWTDVDGHTSVLPNAKVSITAADVAMEHTYAFDDRYTWSDNDGDFSLPYLDPGSYVIRVKFEQPDPWLNHEYLDDAFYVQAADVLVLAGDETIDLGTIDLNERALFVGRMAGDSRFSTAVQISRATFPGASPDVPVVYITNGMNYPDALAAGPAAIKQGGVILTVKPDELPAVVAAELARLDPDKVVVVGGEPSVGAAVFAEIDEIVGDAEMVRLGGSNRYETGLMVVDYAFDSADYVYIATGSKYADALSAGPAAGYRNSPVILVDGAAGELDAETLALLEQLTPNQIRIVGNEASVSAGIADSLQQDYADHQTFWISSWRYAGLDRYATSYLINQDAFGLSDVVFAALGTNFADALTGAGVAGAWNAPLYLTPGDCLMPFIADHMIDADSNVLALLGSSASLGAGVENFDFCQIDWSY